MELDAIVELGETDATQNLIRNFFLAEKYQTRHFEDNRRRKLRTRQ